jgi:hypothetical protein
LSIKEYLPAYLDPNLHPSELVTGVNFASGGAGYDPLTSKLEVTYIFRKKNHNFFCR